MTELNKEEALAKLVKEYLTAIKESDTETMVSLAASVSEEDREDTLKAIIEAAEQDEAIVANAGEILAQLQEADKKNDDAAEVSIEATGVVADQEDDVAETPADAEPAV